MIEPSHPQVSVRRQCALLSLNRTSLYLKPRPTGATNERLMRRLDELFTAYPFLGYRKLTALVNRSKPHPAHRIWPYLLKNLAITGPHQVWATDITYIRLGKGYCYLTAIIDWHSRYIVAWRLSATMESDCCVAALREALAQGTPAIFNTDQGSQFTATAFTDVLTEAGVRISMDGRGSYYDNIFTERFWRSVKYKEVYLRDYTSVEDARAHITDYIAFYNTVRPHQALGQRTPAEIHFEIAERKEAA